MMQSNVVSAGVVGGATVTDKTDLTDNNGQWVVTRLQTNACSLPPSRAQRSEGALTAAARLPPANTRLPPADKHSACCVHLECRACELGFQFLPGWTLHDLKLHSPPDTRKITRRLPVTLRFSGTVYLRKSNHFPASGENSASRKSGESSVISIS